MQYYRRASHSVLATRQRVPCPKGTSSTLHRLCDRVRPRGEGRLSPQPPGDPGVHGIGGETDGRGAACTGLQYGDPSPGGLEVGLSVSPDTQPRHVVIDTTGSKVYGAGEWYVRKYGMGRGRRRIWRKLHLGVDKTTKEIVVVGLTTIKVHDGRQLPKILNRTPGVIAQSQPTKPTIAVFVARRSYREQLHQRPRRGAGRD